MDIYKVLEATTSQRAEDRNSALKLLEDFASSNYIQVVEGLATVLSNKDAQPNIRSTAGLYFKNMLNSRSLPTRTILINKWLDLSQDFRKKIKDMILSSLGTEKTKPSICAQLISSISFAEFQINSWTELLPALTSNITGSDNQELKEASIEAVGYICQDLPQGVLTPYSSDLLNNIIFCMKKEESDRVRVVATKALLNSIEFIGRNFEVEMQRNMIMQFVCESSVSPVRQIKIAGLQCLSKIVSLYYNFMETYMTQALFSITFDAMKSQDSDVALQGIEFWSSLSEEEQNINICAEEGDKQMFMNKNYSIKALPYIIPCILERLSANTEDDDEDSWNPHKAASVCLMLMANVCGNEIIPHLLPFIGESYQSQDPKRRDASMIAFGSLIDASGATQIKQILMDAHLLVITLSKDQCPRVRDSALWTLGKMYETQPELSNNLDSTVQSLSVSYDGLKDLPRVATNACWAFNYMIKAMYELAVSQCGSRPQTLYISTQYENILSAVYATIKREDGGGTHLRAAAFELLNKLIECHPCDKHDLITGSLSYILQEISTLFNAMNLPLSPAQISECAQYQSLYFISLQNCVKILDVHEVSQIAEPLLHSLINNLKLSGASSVKEEILQTIGFLIQCAPQQLISAHIFSFMPCVIECLANSSEIALCAFATSVLGDVCTACCKLISPFSQSIMNFVIKHLLSEIIDPDLKIPLLTLCGDIALALGTDFRIFLSETLNAIQNVSSISASSDDDVDYIELVDEIKYTALDTYTSIIQGMYSNSCINDVDIEIWTHHIDYALQLIDSIANDPNHSDSAARSSCGLIGDLLNTFKPNINTPAIRSLVDEATRSSNSKTQNIAIWLKRVMETL